MKTRWRERRERLTATIRLPPLHPTQEEVQRSTARFKVLACGRRWGKTRLGTVAAMRTVLSQPKCRLWWIAPSYKLVEPGWRALKMMAAQIPGSTVRDSEREIVLPSKSVIAARSGDDPDSLRGESLDGAVLDECAFMKRAVWYEAIRPALSDHKGWCMFISTPNGAGNFFYDLYALGVDGAQPDWQAWRLPTSANPFIDPLEIEAARSVLPERIFRQEYLAEFIEGDGAVFRGLHEVCIADPQSAPLDGHQYVAGIDWARVDDFTVTSVFDATTGTQVYLDRFNKIGWELQRKRIGEVLRRFGVRTALAEENSIGGPNIEALQLSGFNVRPFTTTQGSKTQLIDEFALALERKAAGVEAGSVTLLKDATQRHELESYQMQRLESGLYRYCAPAGAHDDTVIAAALGLRAMRFAGASIRFG